MLFLHAINSKYMALICGANRITVNPTPPRLSLRRPGRRLVSWPGGRPVETYTL